MLKYYLILALLVCLVWANAINNSFVWDDAFLIVHNKNIDMPFSKMASVFTRSLWSLTGFTETDVYYRPIVSLLFILNYKLWGLNPAGFHVVNLLFHLIIVSVLFKSGLLLFDKEKNKDLISFFGASLFAVHPVNNEHVGRPVTGEIIFGLFVVLAVYFFLKKNRPLSYAMFFLALLSKESAVMLPAALMVAAMHDEGVEKGAFSVLPYFALTGVYLILRMVFMDSMFGVPVNKEFDERCFTMAAAFLDYVRLLFVPYPLSPFYPARWHESLADPKVLAGLLVILLLALLAFRIRRDRAMLFLLIFPLLMLAPVIWRVNAFNVGREYVYIAERFLYIPAMFAGLFVAAVVVRALENRTLFERELLVIWGVVILVFSSGSISANMIWKNNTSLFERIVEESPGLSFAHMALGFEYRDAGKMDDAVREWERTLEIRPDIPILYSHLGNHYFSSGEYDKAIGAFRKMIKRFPGHTDAYYNLAVVLEKTGNKEEAAVYKKVWTDRMAASKQKKVK